jgi:hypothetical protein
MQGLWGSDNGEEMLVKNDFLCENILQVWKLSGARATALETLVGHTHQVYRLCI